MGERLSNVRRFYSSLGPNNTTHIHNINGMAPRNRKTLSWRDIFSSCSFVICVFSFTALVPFLVICTQVFRLFCRKTVPYYLMCSLFCKIQKRKTTTTEIIYSNNKSGHQTGQSEHSTYMMGSNVFSSRWSESYFLIETIFVVHCSLRIDGIHW